MRRFYVFNSLEVLKEHIFQVKTLKDLMQLRDDIYASGTNLTGFVEGPFEGLYCVDHLELGNTYRHIFVTRELLNEYGPPSKEDAQSYTVLEDE